MDRTAKMPAATTRDTVRRMLRMAEVTRLMGDMPRAAALADAAEKMWQGARESHAAEEAARKDKASNSNGAPTGLPRRCA